MEEFVVGACVGILVSLFVTMIIVFNVNNAEEYKGLKRWSTVDEYYEKHDITYEKWAVMNKTDVENFL